MAHQVKILRTGVYPVFAEIEVDEMNESSTENFEPSEFGLDEFKSFTVFESYMFSDTGLMIQIGSGMNDPTNVILFGNLLETDGNGNIITNFGAYTLGAPIFHAVAF